MQIFFDRVRVTVLAVVAFAPAPQVFAQRLEILGVTGGYSNSRATGVSGNGTVIVGSSEGMGRWEAFHWTKGNGMVSLAPVSSGYYNLKANGVSVDGSVIVGVCSALNREQLAFRWTKERGMEVLEGLQEREGGSWASGASTDGSVVVGALTRPTDQDPGEVQEAFRWTKQEGPQGLGDLPDRDNLGDVSAEFGSRAVAVSADGSVIVGHDLKHGEAFRWSNDRGMRGLGRLPGGGESWAFAVSADGATIVGASTTSVQDAHQAVRWTTDVGIESLGKLSDGDSMSSAHGVSKNGAVIVGVAMGEKGPQAFRWTKDVGMVGLGTLPEGYDRSSAAAVSADGSVIVGFIAGEAGYRAVRWVE